MQPIQSSIDSPVTAAAPAAGHGAHPIPTACRNCEAPMQGPYCAQCGQHAVHHDPTVHDLVHDATHEFLHLDGKIFLTLRLLLTRPGELTREFLRGRRARFVSPIRLYLTCSLVYFVLAALTNPVEKAVARGESEVRLTRAPAQYEAARREGGDSAARVLEAVGRKRGGVFGAVLERTARVQRDEVGFARRMRATMPKLFFVFVPLFAAVVALVYRRRGHYPSHLYFAIHYFAFCFVASSIAHVVGMLPGMSFPAGVLASAAFAGYGLLALRRVYDGTWGTTLARGAAVAALSGLAFAALSLATVLLVFFTF